MSVARSNMPSTAPFQAPFAAWVPGEFALGCLVEIVKHDDVPDMTKGVVVGHNVSAGTLRVDVTGDTTRDYRRQLTVDVRDDQILSYDVVSGVELQYRLWLAPNFGAVMASEGFDPMDARLVREWPPRAATRGSSIRLSRCPSSPTSLARAGPPARAGARQAAGVAPQDQITEEDDFKCAFTGVETCVLVSPTGEFFDFGGQRMAGRDDDRRNNQFKFFIERRALPPP